MSNFFSKKIIFFSPPQNRVILGVFLGIWGTAGVKKGPLYARRKPAQPGARCPRNALGGSGVCEKAKKSALNVVKNIYSILYG
jgi:hypothetical protein